MDLSGAGQDEKLCLIRAGWFVLARSLRGASCCECGFGRKGLSMGKQDPDFAAG
jgi:hypothetical protein